MRREKKVIYITLAVILLFSISLTFGCGSSKLTSSSQPSNKTTLSTNNKASSTTPVATVSATITVGNGPSGIAYDSKMGEMFVANHDDNTVSVILDNNILDNKNAVVATVKVGTWPTSVAYDSGQGEVYVVSNVGGSISVISDKTNNVIATVTGLTYSPNDIVYDSGMKKLFVAESQNGSNNGAVDVIDDISHTVIKTIPTKGAGTVIVCDAATGELFTPGDGQNIYAISDSTYDVTTIPLASYPGPAAYDPAKGEIFVSLPVGETLVSGFAIIKEGNNTVTKTVTTSHPGYFAYNSVKGEMYTETANNTISIITDSGTTVIANLSLSQISTGPMAYDTSLGKLFVINRAYQGPSVNTVSVITPAS
jgi:DNA-binding beta-propeller fold protein YncE